MTSIDLLIIYVLMVLVFLRHMSIYQLPNKISYTPVVLTLGITGFSLHFILFAQDMSVLEVIKQSIIPMLIGIILGSVMHIMNQSVSGNEAEEQRQVLSGITQDIDNLKTSVSAFSYLLEHVARMEDTTHDQLRNIFKEEIEAINVVQANQKLFITKIETLLSKQQAATDKFEEFTLTEIPSLDNIVHRHIDLLRIAEQDHFNQIKHAIRTTSEEQKQIHAALDELKQHLNKPANIPLPENAAALLRKELERIIHEFDAKLRGIGSKSEQMVTTLQENDAILKASREQSELIMQQMVLSSNQMRELSAKAKELGDSLKPLSRLFASAEELHRDYAVFAAKTDRLFNTLDKNSNNENDSALDSLKETIASIDSKLVLLSAYIERERSGIADTKTVQELASKVRLHKSYIGENQE